VKRLAQIFHDPSRFVQPEHAVVDEDAGELITDGAMDSAAVTVESTPPLKAHTTPARPTRARMRAASRSTKLSMVQSALALHTRNKKFARMSLPRWVCTTSGWNWTPNRRRCGSAHAAIGELALCASTSQPAGNDSTLSPWLIHTGMGAPSRPANRSPASSTISSAGPNSRCGARVTAPPAKSARTSSP
jgi:hypothetical protein